MLIGDLYTRLSKVQFLLEEGIYHRVAVILKFISGKEKHASKILLQGNTEVSFQSTYGHHKCEFIHYYLLKGYFF